MTDYIKIFQNEEEYNEYFSEHEKPEIQVSWLKDEGGAVFYKEEPQPSVRAVKFSTTGSNSVMYLAYYETTFEYSYNGNTWSSMTSNEYYEFGQGSTSGDAIYIRGINAHTIGFTASNRINVFNFLNDTAKVDVEGNVMYLLDYTQDLDTIPYVNCFSNLFGNEQSGCTALQSVSEDFLPATTLGQGCYSQMFRNCTSLIQAPTLPATTLAIGCYNGMFLGCTSLSSITSYATDISASYCLMGWLMDVSETGTLRVPSSMVNQYPSGMSGIPDGWEYGEIE